MIQAPHRVVARRVRRVGLVGLVLALVVGCTGSSGGGGSANGGAGGSNGSGNGGGNAAAVQVDIQPAANAKNVPPLSPVVVKASGGTLASVRVASSAGAALAGQLDGGKTTWTSTGKLAFGTTYRVTAAATDSGGKSKTEFSTFTTVKAKALVFPAVSPLRGMTVGVGMPIRVYFSAPVTDQKAAIDHMKVVTSVPTEGAWHWFSSTEVHWRPRTYWQAGTQVALDASLYGVDLGGGSWGGVNASRHIDFTIGASHVSVADARTHQMKVYLNGKLVRTMPASLGKEVPGRYTKTGPHVVTEKNRVMTMDSRTYGLALDAGGYRAKVEWATRISNGGEFVHSAPWSVAQQGHENVSHGCINVSPSNAAWFFNFSVVGDVVEVAGTPAKLGPKDGDIYDWAIPWSQWTQN